MKKDDRPVSVEKNRDAKIITPKTTDTIKRFVPKGKFLTTSKMKRSIVKGINSNFQSIFLNRKKNNTILNLKFTNANKKLSKKTKNRTPKIVKIVFKIIFFY